MNEFVVRIDVPPYLVIGIALPIAMLIALHDTKPAERPAILGGLGLVFGRAFGRG